MEKKQPQVTPSPGAQAVQKAQGEETLKNQNPNQTHNSKKEGLGPNTKR